LPVGVTSPPTFLAGARWHWLDWGFAQYRPNKGPLADWLARQAAAAAQTGLGLVVSINVLDGNGRNAPLTAEQLREFGTALAAAPGACALTMWKYDVKDPSYFQRQDIAVAAREIARVAAAHPARACSRR
jgi:hypothetical protein